MKGALQEEVLFCCYPELLVTRLVAERLDRDEVLLIHGVDKYNDMIGYGEKISIANNGPEQSPVGPDRRRRKQIVIMDALEFSSDNYQYGTTAIMRELNKVMNSFLAFYVEHLTGIFFYVPQKGSRRFSRSLATRRCRRSILAYWSLNWTLGLRSIQRKQSIEVPHTASGCYRSEQRRIILSLYAGRTLFRENA